MNPKAVSEQEMHAAVRREFSHVGRGYQIHEQLLLDAPPLVRDCWNAFFGLLSTPEGHERYARNVLALARRFVAEVDPLRASPELRRQLAALAEYCETWPGLLSAGSVMKDELQKLKALPLRRKLGRAKTRKELGIIGQLVAAYYPRLVKLAECPHLSRIGPSGDRVLSEFIRNSRTGDIKLVANRPLPGERAYWEYHYIEGAKIAPPFDRRSENAAIWSRVALQMLDSEHGTAAVRRAARRRHLEGRKQNPRRIPEGTMAPFWLEKNRREASQECIDHELAVMERLDRRRAWRVRDDAAFVHSNAAERFPCITAWKVVRDYLLDGSDRKKGEQKTVQNRIKGEDAFYNKIRREFAREIAKKLPVVEL